MQKRLLSAGLLALAIASSASAAAQTVITSNTPEAVGVTIYRDPERQAETMELDWLRGYALITEQRTIDLPAGKSVLRLEGVAGGMLPESAIILGLPGDVREKNLDADLLSPGNLYAHAFGRPVTLRRQHDKGGTIREEPAVIRSGPDGSVIVQTRDGFEAANCGPLHDTLAYDGVPPGLSAKPTLSVEVDSPKAVHVTVTLSYLAWGFDWLTNYVVHMRPDGRHADILAWATLASSDPVSFPDANAAVIGGKVNREDGAPYISPYAGEALTYHCYFRPLGPGNRLTLSANIAGEDYGDGEIVVTAQRRSETLMGVPAAMTANEEGLGDLKLYRLPVPTTIASNAQKQVAMFVKPNVKLAIYYSATVGPDDDPLVSQMLRMRNRKGDGLGIAMPTGRLALFERHRGQPALAGEGVLIDSAKAQDVEVSLGEASQVTVAQEELAHGDTWEEHEVTARNANPWPVDFEGRIIFNDDERLDQSSARIEKRNGKQVWRVRIPANGPSRLRYTVREIE